MITTLAENETLHDGKIYDSETGDYLRDAIEEGFTVKDEESFEWVMRKMLDAEAEIHAVQNNTHVLAAKAVLENAAKMEKQAKARRDWFESRFKDEVAEYAKQFITEKSKTYKTVLGSVSFRKVPTKVIVTDEEQAIKLAELKCPEAVKVTKKFLISQATDEFLMNCYAGAQETGQNAAFEIVPEHETVTIKTGVSK